MGAVTLIARDMDFEGLYRAHFACVWRALRRFGVSERDAQDLTQETFITACRRANEFEGRSSIKTWLIGIAYRLAANHRRNGAARREILDDDAVEASRCGLDFERQFQQREELRQLEKILSELPLKLRDVFTMFEIDGLTGEEIATVLDVPLGTVRSRMRLAREAFHAAIERATASEGQAAAVRGAP
jgi:RNA polymerase sigma-70 factor (ECF subfamily)